MHLLLYLLALAAAAAALGLSIRDLGSEVPPGPEVLESALPAHGPLLVGGAILAGPGRVLPHLRAIDFGLGRVATAAEEAARLDG